MLATVNVNRLATYRTYLKEGSMYSITGFDNFWLSYSSLLIRFSDATSLDEITKPASPIPEECFRLCNNTRCLVLPTHTQFPSIYTLFQQGD
ncbi:unnamed protein product [Brassica rapa]|uniref:Uncharacterized protein n=1 Tax=Brassica campestris TaxID=3711 RepID=A0A8D9CPV0_BRACM|nr:unnamed protein product [Brassica rapa]